MQLGHNNLLQSPGQAKSLMKKVFASTRGSVSLVTQWKEACTSTETSFPSTKINSIFDFHRSEISEIKLKRTDTTLDLSQKAKRAKEEKKWFGRGGNPLLIPFLSAG